MAKVLGKDRCFNESSASVFFLDMAHGQEQTTYNPPSLTIALNSLAIYWTGVPVGGVARNWTRDFTTSEQHGADNSGRKE